MRITLNRKKPMSWLVVLCMIIPMLVPVLSYAQTDDGKITVNGICYSLSVMPEKTELGLMVSAIDMADAFCLEYVFDSENKLFEIYDETRGEILLMHNATIYYIGEDVYDCLPYFYLRNGEPLIEAGFFCDLFGAAYEYDENTKELTVVNDAAEQNTSENDVMLMSVESVLSGEITCPQGAPDGGLSVGVVLQQIGSNADGTAYCVGESYLLGTAEFAAGETSKSYTYDVSAYYSDSYPYFSVYYAELNDAEYGYYNNSGATTKISYSPLNNSQYNSEAKKFEYTSNSGVNILVDRNYITGIVKLPDNVTAPNGGVNVNLILQTRSTNYNGLYGTTSYYYIGDTYTVGTVTIPDGSNSEKYKFNISYYINNGQYTDYSMYYSSEDSGFVKPYGFYDNDGNVVSIDYISTYGFNYQTSAKLFGAADEGDINFTIPIKDGALNNCVLSPQTDTASGNVGSGTTITLRSDTSGASIYYTTDGSTPTASSTPYTGGITIYKDTMIKAIAVKQGMADSGVTTFTYLVNADDDLHKFVVGRTEAVINREAVTLEAAPYSDNGEIYVSAGDVAKAIGATAYWNGDEVTFSYNGNSFTLTVGDGNCFKANDLTMVNVMGVLNGLSLPIQVENLNISLTVKSISYGDVNCDGKIDLRDVLLLRRYNLKWNVKIDKLRADVNCDGKIDNRDVLILRRYLAKWNVTLGK